MRATVTHLGMGLLVTLYCVGGVYLFRALEEEELKDRVSLELKQVNNLTNTKEKLRLDLIQQCGSKVNVSDIRGCTDQLFLDFETAFAAGVNELQYGFPPHLVRNDVKWDNTTGLYEYKSEQSYWSFSSALLFTVSIVTTVGYGHIAPITAEGQWVCIVYAVLGIPLMLMFLANIGEVMANSFRVVYGKGCCYLCWKKRRQNYEYNKRKVLQAHGKQSRSPPSVRKGKKGDDDDIDWDYLKTIDPKTLENPSEEIVNVPITLTLVVIAVYIFIGAILFAHWEEWSWISGAYFSFVTLSTIGFGDLVPGWNQQRGGEATQALQMLASTLYIVLGLAMLSMSFNLMMEEMIAKFRWMGKRMGIVDESKPARIKALKGRMGRVGGVG